MQVYTQKSLIKKSNNYEVSVYSGDNLTPEGLAKNIKTLQHAFPELDSNFHIVFADRIEDLKIGDNRLKDSINFVIDNCAYPKPTIAQFISFDKRVKLYDHRQMVELNNEMQGKAFTYHKQVVINGVDIKPIYANIKDIELYNLEVVKQV